MENVQETPKKSKKPQEIKRVWKDQREFVHDLFKLSVGIYKKNVSFKKYEPMIVNVEHCHWFHSKDRHGKTQTKSTFTGGHYHDIIMVDGVPTCGPAKRRTEKRIRGKNVMVEEQTFYGADTLEEAKNARQVDPGSKAFVDDHTHDLNYMHSEKIMKQ